MKRSRDRLFAILADAARLSDEELLELHRVLSITASRIRLRDPEWQRRRAAGMAARAPLSRSEPASGCGVELR